MRAEWATKPPKVRRFQRKGANLVPKKVGTLGTLREQELNGPATATASSA